MTKTQFHKTFFIEHDKKPHKVTNTISHHIISYHIYDHITNLVLDNTL